MPETSDPHPQMTPVDAFNLLSRALPSIPTDLPTHMKLQKALTVLGGCVSAQVAAERAKKK